MPTERETSPIVRTYLTQSKSPSENSKIHARIYSREYDLDKRGSGRTLSSALRNAKRGVSRPK